ncbi:hypothetical protein EMIT043CA1_40061 [Pseudomonas brassicacearum]
MDQSLAAKVPFLTSHSLNSRVPLP